MYHAIIINPAAGKNNNVRNMTELFKKTFTSRGLSYGIYVTQRPLHCSELVTGICRDHSDEDITVYACGGDGTLNEAMTGLLGFPNARLTQYACGTGNDFIKNFGILEKHYLDVDRLIDSTEERVCDVIKGVHRPCLNIATAGLDARIAGDVKRLKRIPFLRGALTYHISVLTNLIKGLGERYHVEVDGKSYDGEFSMVVIASGSYYGGGYHPVPEARCDDGVLDVLLVRKLKRLEAASVINLYRDGRYAEIPQVEKLMATDVIVRSQKNMAINYDGEIEWASEAHFSMNNEKIRFVLPKM